MKTTKKYLRITLFIAGFGVGLSFYQFVNNLLKNELISPLQSIRCGNKFLSFVCLFLIGNWVYLIVKSYENNGFMNDKNVRTIRKIGFVTLFVACLNSLVEVLRQIDIDKIMNLPKSGILGSFVGSFVGNFILESPLLLFFAILSFIMADFMQKAITIKNENESFI